MILVDTNILSELTRPKPDARVLAWAATVHDFRVSVLSIEEISYGLARRPSARITAAYEKILQESRLLKVDSPIARRAGELRARMAVSGQVRSQADMVIAATAEIHQLPLATRNVRDFEGCPVRVINPFAR